MRKDWETTEKWPRMDRIFHSLQLMTNISISHLLFMNRLQCNFLKLSHPASLCYCSIPSCSVSFICPPMAISQMLVFILSNKLYLFQETSSIIVVHCLLSYEFSPPPQKKKSFKNEKKLNLLKKLLLFCKNSAENINYSKHLGLYPLHFIFFVAYDWAK